MRQTSYWIDGAAVPISCWVASSLKHKSCREINSQSAIMDLRRRSGHSQWLLWSLMFCLISNNGEWSGEVVKSVDIRVKWKRLRPSRFLFILILSYWYQLLSVSDALKCYFCYGSDESLDCHLPEDEHGNRLESSTPTMKIISCLSSDDYCYKIHYSCK